MSNTDELFTNPQLEFNHLPEADRLTMIPLEPAYKTVRYISSAAIAGVILFISWFLFITELKQWPAGIYIILFISLISIWNIFYNGISFHYMGYALREKDVSFKSGWLWRSTTTVPFNRVQHCDIKEGLIDRQFGLAKLTIYTAGGQSTDLMIPGLLPETAERLKTYILRSTEQPIVEE